MYTVCFTFDVRVNSVMHFISTQSLVVGHRSLYGRNNVNPVSWLVHICKQDIGMWKVIARTYQGSWSRRGELCYQLHTAIPMNQPAYWCYQIFMKKWELCISAKFEQNSENKESAYQIYKVCMCHYAYVWNVKRSYGVFWLYLESLKTKWVSH